MLPGAFLLFSLIFSSPSQATLFYCRDDKGTLQAGDSNEELSAKCGKKVQALPSASTESKTGSPSRSASDPVQLTLQHDGNSLLVPVSFAAGVQATLLLDTGASSSVIPTRIAKKLGLAVVDRVEIITAGGKITADLVEVPEISLGGATVRNLHVAAYDIPSQRSEGLLGLDFLNHFKVSIDTETGVLELKRK